MRATLAFAIPLLGLVTFVGLAPGDNPQEDPHRKAKAAQAAIVALSQNLDAPDVRERSAKIVRENNSEDISSTFQHTRQGGLGAGVVAINPNQDSIAFLVRRWTSRPPTAEQLAKNQEEYVRVTKIIRAMSELAPYRVPKNARPQVVKEWAEVASEFHETALGLHQAVEKGEPKLIRDAARKINNTCCHCHGLLD